MDEREPVDPTQATDPPPRQAAPVEQPSQAGAPPSSDMEGERDREPPLAEDEPALAEEEDVGGG